MANSSDFRRWHLRSQSKLSYAIFIFYGVLLNPALWWLGWFDPEKTRMFNDRELITVLLISNLIMCTTAFLMLKKRTFDLFDMAGIVTTGLIVAIASTPPIVTLFEWTLAGAWDLGELFTVVIGVFILGWMLGFIPYFAATYGVFCAVALFFIVLILSRPVPREHKSKA